MKLLLLLLITLPAFSQIKSVTGVNSLGITWGSYINSSRLYTKVTLTPAAVGLQYVNNTSDLNKPISIAVSNALKLKSDTIKVLTDLIADLSVRLRVQELKDSVITFQDGIGGFYVNGFFIKTQ